MIKEAPPRKPPPATPPLKRQRAVMRPIGGSLIIAAVGIGIALAIHTRGAPSAGPSPTARPITAAARANAVQLLGVYPGDGDGPATVVKYRDFVAMLGRQTSHVVEFGDESSPAALTSSAWGTFTQPAAWGAVQGSRPRMVLSVPLAFGPFNPSAATGASSLAGIAAGGADAAYRYVADTLVAAGYRDAIIRIGWEFDGNWMPWSASNDPAAYKAAYRRVHDIFRAASAAFVFDWCGTAGYARPASAGSAWHGAMDWSQYYPGDDLVDTVGLDVYDEGSAPYDPTGGTWTDPKVAWAGVLPELQAQLAFAQAHGKQVSFPEWGLWGGPAQSAQVHGGGDDPTFVQGMFDWLSSLPVKGPGSLSFQAYFNGDPGGTNGFHDLNRFPNSRQLFLSLFSRQGA